MFFKKKKEEPEYICPDCESDVDDSFSFCPYCGLSLMDPEEEMEEFGMLGKNNAVNNFQDQHMNISYGLTDRFLGSLINNLAKTFEQQFREIEKSEVSNMPNGIKIKIGMPQQRMQQQRTSKPVSEDQLKKMASLPRAIAKTTVRRLSDKVIYELNTPGLMSVEDVIVSKLESGYEIKAIGDKKVYVNSLPIKLPLRSFSISDNKLLVEFLVQ
ncbi:hypothetical protein HYW75_01045 [Candidatus Pacearchaeota archaeon]|nr:hypothetical protein [Candidatus Pacearchaeota archaeon]